MKTRNRRPRRRAGFTLTELMIVVVLVGIIGTMLTTLLVRQQSFHRAVASVADARARMRDVATILPTDLRSISTIDGDVTAIAGTTVQFRAFVGASILCSYVAGQPTWIELPPQKLNSGNVLSAWINPPGPGDVAFVYDDGAEAGNADDNWTMFTITDTTSSTDTNWCKSTNSPAYTQAGDAARRYRLILGAAPDPARIKIGAPMRFAREVRYSGYQGADNNWYVGYQTCPGGACGAVEVLAGPIVPVSADAATSGLYFNYYNQAGVEVTDVAQASTIARVEVVIRTTSESLRRATRINAINTEIAGGDSLRFVIGFRNRI